MNTLMKATLFTLVLAILAFILGPVLWPSPADVVQPTPVQSSLFMFFGVIEALTFGAGISLLIFGWNAVHEYPLHKQPKAIVMLLSLVWLFVSWWPHDNLHRFNGEDLAGLLAIEYGFHLTLIFAAFVLTYCFLTLFESWK